jgi:hypothetical protein
VLPEAHLFHLFHRDHLDLHRRHLLHVHTADMPDKADTLALVGTEDKEALEPLRVHS